MYIFKIQLFLIQEKVLNYQANNSNKEEGEDDDDGRDDYESVTGVR